MAKAPLDDDLFRTWLERWHANRRRVFAIGAVLAVAVLAVSGFFSVQPGEVGVVRTFGKASGSVGPGLHWLAPFVQQVDRVSTEQVRRLRVGSEEKDKAADVRGDRMLTADANIVESRIIVLWRVSDPMRFLFKLDTPEEALHANAEVALRSAVGAMRVDEVLTTERDRVERESRRVLQRLMDKCESGIEVLGVQLQQADVPAEVKEAFRDVIRAREEKEKLVNQARAYQADRVPRARGEAKQLLEQATAHAKERELIAQGEAARFAALAAEYDKAPEVTRRRLWLEANERLLARAPQKLVIDSRLAERGVPVLPLGAMLSGAAPVGSVGSVGGAK